MPTASSQSATSPRWATASPTGGLDLVDDGVGRVVLVLPVEREAEVVDHDADALARELERLDAAEAAAGAGDDRDLAVQHPSSIVARFSVSSRVAELEYVLAHDAERDGAWSPARAEASARRRRSRSPKRASTSPSRPARSTRVRASTTPTAAAGSCPAASTRPRPRSRTRAGGHCRSRWTSSTARRSTAAVDRVIAEWGHIDVLVNNAVHTGPGSMLRFDDTTIEMIETKLAANVVAPVVIIKAVLPHMVERGSGTIVNVTSAVAINDPQAPAGEGGWGAAYAMSKGALHRLAGSSRSSTATRGCGSSTSNRGMSSPSAWRSTRRRSGSRAATRAPRRRCPRR